MDMNTKVNFQHTHLADYMNETERAQFKLMLSNWKQQLLEEEANTSVTMSNGAANDADPLDRAALSEELRLELLTRARRSRLVSKIEHSIEQINSDDYGYCLGCGIEIGLLRMRARLTATHCIDCKNIDELRERQVHG